MNRFVRFTLVGCGGLVALVVIIGIIGAIIGTNDTPAGSQQGQTPQKPKPSQAPRKSADNQAQGSGGQQEQQKPKPAQPRGQSSENAVALGQAAKAGDVQWIVTNARQATELKSAFGDAKQGNFVIIDFDFTNGTKDAATLDSSSLTLTDNQGRNFEADTDTYEYVDPSKDIFLDQVNPGVTKQGETIFTVAPNASGFVLQAGDTNMFSDENAYIKLGF